MSRSEFIAKSRKRSLVSIVCKLEFSEKRIVWVCWDSTPEIPVQLGAAMPTQRGFPSVLGFRVFSFLATLLLLTSSAPLAFRAKLSGDY
jgi:hypothetical protein